MTKKVSIVIPCRNEEKYISKCLDSIINSNYDKNFLEVLVCDGMSTDNTRILLQNYKDHTFIKVVDNQLQTTPIALNIGIRNSSGDVVIILGSHAEIYPAYIDKCVSILESDKSIGCVGGILENVLEDSTSSIIAKAMSSSFGVGNAHFRTGSKEGYVDTVAFGAYKREVFDKAGLFDIELVRNQDDEFNYRLIKNGYKIFLSASIKAKYYVRASYQKLAKQYYQYGYWKVYVNKKHGAITTIRQTIPPLFVLFQISGITLSLFSKNVQLIYLATNFLYLLIGLIAALRCKSKFSETPFIMMTFMLLHMSYGLGYLAGTFDFFIFGKKPKISSTKLTR